MVEPEKPFACTIPDCGMTFTNEDHLNVHTRKHDMVLQFDCEQKTVFVADQTPTPTRFIRNCEEVGLFQDLQNVNPFDEGFKRAIETKQGILSLEHGSTPSTDDLHTPQMFPVLDPSDSTYTTTNHKNITISRSSSDESGAIKEFEAKISKLTNEVTIRRIERLDDTPKTKDVLRNSVSYRNNIIKIQSTSNVEIRKATDKIEDMVIKDKDEASKDKDVFDRLQVEAPPIMSQRSIDFVVDSLTTDYIPEKGVKDATGARDDRNVKDNKKNEQDVKTSEVTDKKGEYEVILKLPDGKQIKLVDADVVKEKPKNAKDLLKKVLADKVGSQNVVNNMNILPGVLPTLTAGTLIPLSIVNPTLVTTNLVNTSLVNRNLVNTNLVNTNLVNRNLVNTNLVNTNLLTNLVTPHIVNTNYVPKLPLKMFDKTAFERKRSESSNSIKIGDSGKRKKDNLDASKECTFTNSHEKGYSKSRLAAHGKNGLNFRHVMDSRIAASRRYREKLKQARTNQIQENKQLKETIVKQSQHIARMNEVNKKLTAERALFQSFLTEHMKICNHSDDLRLLQEQMTNNDLK